MNEFEGIFFNGEIPKQHLVRAKIQFPLIEITGPEIEKVSWSIIDVKLINHQKQQGTVELGVDGSHARLKIEDPDIIEYLSLSSPDLFKSEFRAPLKIVGGLMVFAVAMVGLVYMLPNLLIPFISHEYADKIGKGLNHEISEALGGYCTAPRGIKALEKLTTRIAPAANLGHPLSVQVIKSGVVNAYAAPGGNIVFFDQLIKEAKSPEEIAGVLAHEIGHVKNKHGLKNLSRALGVQAIFSGMTGGYVGETGDLILSMAFSRDAEREADQSALEYMEKAKIPTKPLVGFFERLSQASEGETETSLLPSIISSHPPSPERKMFFEQNPIEGSPLLTPLEWKSLRDICK